MSVGFCSFEHSHENKARFPTKFTITLELLNQHRDQDHHRRDIQCEMKKGDTLESIHVIAPEFIHRSAMKWNADKQTLYLRNNCLKFRVVKISFL